MDDSPDIGSIMKRKLSAAGYEVTLPMSLHECMEEADRGCEAFFLDVNMGDDLPYEGLQTLRSLKRKDPRIFCALLTTHEEDEEVRIRSYEYGCDALLGKSSKDLTRFEGIQMALHRMWLSRVTDLPLGPAGDSDALKISNRVAQIGVAAPIAPVPDVEGEEAKKSIERYQQLFVKSLQGPLTASESIEYESRKSGMEAIEDAENTAIETDFPHSGAGRFEAKLRGAERLLQEFREILAQGVR